jgi:hypothetical protein
MSAWPFSLFRWLDYDTLERARSVCKTWRVDPAPYYRSLIEKEGTRLRLTQDGLAKIWEDYRRLLLTLRKSERCQHCFAVRFRTKMHKCLDHYCCRDHLVHCVKCGIDVCLYHTSSCTINSHTLCRCFL